MKVFVMLIMLLHLDPDGYPYTSALQESPMKEYSSLQECDTAAESKREAMLKSSRSYPDLGIVDVRIRCVDSAEIDFDTNDIAI
jgi:hypothetical protein